MSIEFSELCSNGYQRCTKMVIFNIILVSFINDAVQLYLMHVDYAHICIAVCILGLERDNVLCCSNALFKMHHYDITTAELRKDSDELVTLDSSMDLCYRFRKDL